MRIPKQSYCLWMLGMLLGMLISPARADRVAYDKVRDLHVDIAEFSLHHHHDWSANTREVRWKMISAEQNPLSANNTYAYLRLNNKESGKLLFQVPTPALSYLWMSLDKKIIVGLSDIKLWNPYQLIVLNMRGEYLFKQKIAGTTFAGNSESVTNWVRWYKQPQPDIRIEQVGDRMHLSIESEVGTVHSFTFSAK